MDSLTPARLTAFSSDPAGGNPAGVLVADSLPSPARMQAIAAEIGYSESAFLAPRQTPGAWDIRYFAPAAEVDFCGHATIASGVHLALDHGAQGTVTLYSNAGPIRVDLSEDAQGRPRAELTSAAPWVKDAAEGLIDEALATFGWDRNVLASQIAPPAIAFAGVRHLLLPLVDRPTLSAMRYDFDALATIMRREQLTTVALLVRESETHWHARNAFAIGGVVEDPATGAAAAAAGAWLRHNGLVSTPATVEIEQGVDMGRPSLLQVTIDPGDSPIRVAGTATPIGG